MSHNGLVRVLAITALVMCATCGAQERAKRRPVDKHGVKTAFPSGVFAITAARVVSDHCDNRLRFETSILDIDVAAASVHSAPDNRLYEAVLDRGELVARGAFDEEPACQTYRKLEIWRLERHGDDEISGFRTTYWRESRRGDCLEACKVVYAVEALRSDEGESGDDTGDEGARDDCDPNDPLCGI